MRVLPCVAERNYGTPCQYLVLPSATMCTGVLHVLPCVAERNYGSTPSLKEWTTGVHHRYSVSKHYQENAQGLMNMLKKTLGSIREKVSLTSPTRGSRTQRWRRGGQLLVFSLEGRITLSHISSQGFRTHATNDFRRQITFPFGHRPRTDHSTSLVKTSAPGVPCRPGRPFWLIF